MNATVRCAPVKAWLLLVGGLLLAVAGFAGCSTAYVRPLTRTNTLLAVTGMLAFFVGIATMVWGAIQVRVESSNRVRTDLTSLGDIAISADGSVAPLPIAGLKVHPKNVPGDFVVEHDCCLLCGVPWHIAPDLFAYDEKGCWVSRQPTSADETARMLQVLETQELSCIKYRGTDPTIRSRVAPG